MVGERPPVKFDGDQSGGQQAAVPLTCPHGTPASGRKPQEAVAEPAGETAPAPEVAFAGGALFWFNLLFLIFFGIGASIWFVRYTDWFPIVITLFGFGSVFAWFAFLGNIVNDVRKRQAQIWFDEKIMQARWFLLLLVIVLVAGGLFASSYGSAAIAHVQGGVDRVMRINGSDGKVLVEATRLGPGATQKHLVRTGLFGRAEIWVDVAGLPAIKEMARAWRVTDLAVPASFLRRPVLLVRPNAEISRNAHIEENDLKLAASIGGEPVGAPQPYRGQLVWIGCGRDVAVPTERWERWRLELGAEAVPDGWLQRIAIAPERVLAEADEVRVAILRADGTEIMSATTIVTPIDRIDDFPQELVLDDQ